jgi:hypothetical protein
MLQFPLNPAAVAAADAVILERTGGRYLTMAPDDAELRREWVRLYEEALARQGDRGAADPADDRDPADLEEGCPCPEGGIIRRKNIIFIGSEIHYDSFWWKMMFMAPGVTAASGGRPLRPADLTTVAYVPEGYTTLERLPLDAVRTAFGHEIVRLASSADIATVMNDLPDSEENGCPVHVRLQDVVFFSHGLPSQITLNYDGNGAAVTLDRGNLPTIRADAFVADGRLYSYACRTGNSSWWESFSSDAEAHPENSLAQRMADRFQITVYAFLTRTLYRDVLREPADSATLVQRLRDQRDGHELEVIPLSDEHEALPHPGLAETGSSWLGTGARGERTNGFALWRRNGARALPVGASSPTGLSTSIRTFTPSSAGSED